MKRTSTLTVVVAVISMLSGCAAQVTFIDRSNGETYVGKTGGTASGQGDITANVEGQPYSGTWIYERSGDGFALGTAYASSGTHTAVAQGESMVVGATGNGQIDMRASSGLFIRCVFNFNSMSNRGIGECLRNDGRTYDLHISR